jgi:formyltetrahydrofolate deformylase
LTVKFILTTICRDAPGISAAVTTCLADAGAFILESQQHGDPETGNFFLRIAFSAAIPKSEIETQFAEVADRFSIKWAISEADRRPRILIGVSKFGHCLNDLLHRWRTGVLPVEIVGVFSNHDDMRPICDWHGIPYHYLPVGKENRDVQESRLIELAENADFIVLARYMQILSNNLSDAWSWRCINIHHSFLPSFKGAKPYHQAHLRGVKIIGATAHFVTGDLDEGPIIEQDVERVTHANSPDILVRIGQDIEARVLARAVRWVAEKRVLPNGSRTVVFA